MQPGGLAQPAGARAFAGAAAVAAGALGGGRPVPPPPPRRRSPTEPPTAAPLPAKAAEAWRTEIDILRREAEALRERDAPKAALLYGAIAQIATSVMADPSTAAAALHAASQLLPGTGLVRERWIALLSRRDAAVSQRWERALELGRAELPLVGDPHERVALLLEIATVEELVAGDLAHARIALEEAREIDPANVAVLEALAEIYLVEGEWDKLVAALSSMADATGDVVFRSMLRHGAGQIQEVMLDQRAAARASYKIALNDDMTNLPAAASLSSLALQQEDWGELARVLVAEADLVDDPRTVRRLCERAGDLYWERLGDAENAIAAYRRAALATPDEPAPLRKLAAVLESNARWRELIDVYTTELPLIKDPEERADLFHRIGEVHETHLGRIDDAVAAYRSALEAVPTHMPTLQALGALYRAAERWSDLADMDLREAERIGDPERRAARYYEVADLVERRLGDQPHAISLYERCLDLVPGHRAAFAALDQLYRREERWRDIVAMYERQAQAVGRSQAGALLQAGDRAAVARARAQRRQGGGGLPRRARPWTRPTWRRSSSWPRRWSRRSGGSRCVEALDKLAAQLRDKDDQSRDAAPAGARARGAARTGGQGAGGARARARARRGQRDVAARHRPAALSRRTLARRHHQLRQAAAAGDDARGAGRALLPHWARLREEAGAARRRADGLRGRARSRRRLSAGAARARSHPPARSAVAAPARGARQAGAHRAHADGAGAAAPRARADLRAAPARSGEGGEGVRAGGQAVVAVRGGGGGAGARARGARAVRGARAAVHAICSRARRRRRRA